MRPDKILWVMLRSDLRVNIEIPIRQIHINTPTVSGHNSVRIINRWRNRFQFLLLTIAFHGAAASSFHNDTPIYFNLVNDLVMLTEKVTVTHNGKYTAT